MWHSQGASLWGLGCPRSRGGNVALTFIASRPPPALVFSSATWLILGVLASWGFTMRHRSRLLSLFMVGVVVCLGCQPPSSTSPMAYPLCDDDRDCAADRGFVCAPTGTCVLTVTDGKDGGPDASHSPDGGTAMRTDAGVIDDGNRTDAGGGADAGGTLDGGAWVDAGQPRDGGLLVDGGGVTPPVDPGCLLPTPSFPNLVIHDQGRFRRVYQFPMGEGLSPRDVTVFLPAAYEVDALQRFPVVYMHDGQNLFDAAEAAFGVEWQVDETVDRLVESGQMEPVIVVGISNTSERIEEYTPDVDESYGGGKGDTYLAAIVNRIKPFIDSRFRTACDRASTSMAGSSLGGLITFRAFERHPEIFGRFACLSSSFWWNDQSVLQRVSALGSQVPQRMWIDGGQLEGTASEGGLSSTLYTNRRMITELINRGAVYGSHVASWEDLAGSHNEQSWARRLPSAFRFLLNDHDVDWQQVETMSVTVMQPRLSPGDSTALLLELSFGDRTMTWPPELTALQLSNTGILSHRGHGLWMGQEEGATFIDVSSMQQTTAAVVQVGRPAETAIGFHVVTPGDPTQVYVAGDATSLGAWRADGLLLMPHGNGEFRGWTWLTRDMPVAYKYTQGTWVLVEKGAAGEEIADRTHIATNPTILHDVVQTWNGQP